MNTRNWHSLVTGTALLMLVGGVTNSCKDFLDQAPQGALDLSTLTTRTGVEGLLIAAYRSLDHNNGVGGNWGNAGSNWVWGSVASDDAYRGSSANDQPPIADVEVYHWNTGEADTYLNEKWTGVFDGVARCNATLRLLAKVLQEKPAEISASDAASIKGEALFLRAHFEFEAWQMWGKVPYYFEDDVDYRKPNNMSSDSVVKLIIKDLDDARAILPSAPRSGQAGRATKFKAMAYKGRVQVNAGQYAAGRATLQEVVDSAKFALETSFDHVWTGFPQFANGKETILAYNASVNDGQPNGDNGNWGERLNFPYSGSPFKCCGFHQPSQNLVNFFAVDDSGLPTTLTNPNWNANNSNFVANTTVAVDPRLDWTVGRDHVPYKDWGLHESGSGWVRDALYSGPYSPKKNVHEKASGAQSKVGWQPEQLNAVHLHIFRYADLLLELAEAEVQAGNLENARTIVNQIRARAGQMAQGCGTTTDSLVKAKYPTCATDPSLAGMAIPMIHQTNLDSLRTPWALYRIGRYTTPWTDQQFAWTAVQLERRLELAMEGHRFFDLRRWGIADTTINSYINVEQARRTYLAVAVGGYAARHREYPIPSVQIDLSVGGPGGGLVQNTGW